MRIEQVLVGLGEGGWAGTRLGSCLANFVCCMPVAMACGLFRRERVSSVYPACTGR